ncbi:ABC transporter ATP-binding protein [Tepidibacter sp. Z1-5]|uniref:ABC transporter ATP-binding protein n=1 Tax=Tepidibacter sp. Z1-5 TaxID=3134138 RepID=UPI0030C16BB7
MVGIKKEWIKIDNSIVVKTENLTKSFLNKEIIKNCNMTVYEGSIYGLLGANGIGKTTVFKLLTGLLKSTMGKIEILGMDMAVSKNDILRNIGCLIETPVFYEHLSANQNLKIHLGEPISGLDPMGIRDMRELFLELAKTHNTTILISSHILSEIEHIADTIGVINNGKIIKEDTLSSLKTQFTDGLENYFLDLMNGGK